MNFETFHKVLEHYVVNKFKESVLWAAAFIEFFFLLFFCLLIYIYSKFDQASLGWKLIIILSMLILAFASAYTFKHLVLENVSTTFWDNTRS